jgi:hypothetical protein
MERREGDAMPVTGSTIRLVWTILDQNGDPLTGMHSPADVSFRLHRSSLNGTVASGEAVSMVEVAASPGTYEITFVPLATGLYTLQLRELNASTLFQQYRFPTDVFSAGSEALPTFDDAFCSQSDVERFMQLSVDSTTDPSADDVALFAAGRAKEMQGLLAAAGWTVSPATIVADSVEQGILREVNAVGAAGDAWLAKDRDDAPAASEHGRKLLDEYEIRLTRAVDFGRKMLGTSLIASPMTEGEVTLRTETAVDDTGLQEAITMGQEF